MAGRRDRPVRGAWVSRRPRRIDALQGGVIPRCRRPPVSTSRPATRTRSASSSCRAPRSGSAAPRTARSACPSPSWPRRSAGSAAGEGRGNWSRRVAAAARSGSTARRSTQPCPIPFDVPFRVGDHWLTLRPTNTAAPDWASSYRSSPPLEQPTASFVALEDLRVESPADDAPGSDPAGPSSPEAEPDHLTRWQSRRPRRDGGPGAGREQKLWEERWKTAGERLRAAAGGDAAYRSAATPPPAYETATARLPEAPIPRSGLRERSSPAFEAPPPPIVPPVVPPPSAPLAPSPRISPTDAPGPVPYEPPRPKRERPGASWQAAPLPPRPQPEAWPHPPATPPMRPQPPRRGPSRRCPSCLRSTRRPGRRTRSASPSRRARNSIEG